MTEKERSNTNMGTNCSSLWLTISYNSGDSLPAPSQFYKSILIRYEERSEAEYKRERVISIQEPVI